jgi:hypothetical protein
VRSRPRCLRRHDLRRRTAVGIDAGDIAVHRIFTQEDPIGYAGGINLYGYVGNDPVSYTDPFGLCQPFPECLLKVANAVGQFALGAAGQLMIGAAAGSPGGGLLGVPDGMSMNVNGVQLNTTAATGVSVTVNESTGNAALMFEGAVRVTIDGSPDAVATKGFIDLGTGQFEVKGHLNVLGGKELTSFHATGSIVSQSAAARVCVPLHCWTEEHPPKKEEP